MRILENMKRPTVIVESLTDDQNKLIGDALKAWRYITGKLWPCSGDTRDVTQIGFESG